MSSTQSDQDQLNSYKFNNLANYISLNKFDLLKKAPIAIIKAPAKLWYTTISFIKELPVNSDLRYKTVALSCGLLFFSICFLSASNPMLLLWPGEIFKLPIVESREYMSLVGLKRNTKQIIAYERAIKKGLSIKERVYRISQMSSLPLNFKDTRLSGNYFSSEPLPKFANAIRQIWFNKKSGKVIIDIRQISLEKELDLFFQNAPVTKKRKRHLADSWFKVATTSILGSSEKIKHVQFLLDGRSSNWLTLSFSLKQTYK